MKGIRSAWGQHWSRRYNHQLLRSKRGKRVWGQAPALLLNATLSANLRASSAFPIGGGRARGAEDRRQ
jgi:hypothetical protein